MRQVQAEEPWEVPATLSFTISWNYLREAVKRGIDNPGESREGGLRSVSVPQLYAAESETHWEMVIPKMARPQARSALSAARLAGKPLSNASRPAQSEMNSPSAGWAAPAFGIVPSSSPSKLFQLRRDVMLPLMIAGAAGLLALLWIWR
jgi:hypothetical protein